jgi:NAD+ synthase
MTLVSRIGYDALRIDAERVVDESAAHIESQVRRVMRKRGVVVGLSGGIDSSVVAALSARALGASQVVGLLMPERESSSEALELGRLVAECIGIETIVEDITGVLDSAGCYPGIRAGMEVEDGAADGRRQRPVPPLLCCRARA